MADPRTKLKTKILNCQMEPYIAEMLTQMNLKTGLTKAQLVREGIISRFRMMYANEPHCADNTSCKCPAMHTVQPATRISDEDLVIQQQEQNKALTVAPNTQTIAGGQNGG